MRRRWKEWTGLGTTTEPWRRPGRRLHEWGDDISSTGIAPSGRAPPLLAGPQPADGNRWYQGKDALTTAEPIDLVVAGRPVWVSMLSAADGVVVAVVMADGSTAAWSVTADRTAVPVGIDPFVGSAPPVIGWDGERVVLRFGEPASAGPLAFASEPLW